METIRTTAELYAHALAMEEEAAHRYVDFALRANAEGHAGLADLFWTLGRAEGEHYAALLRRADQEKLFLPAVPERRHRWIDAEPEGAARDFVLRLMTPRQALAIALEAERRSRDFFNAAAHSAQDPQVRTLARDMAAEENEHIARLIEHMDRLQDGPARASEWDRLFVEKAA